MASFGKGTRTQFSIHYHDQLKYYIKSMPKKLLFKPFSTAQTTIQKWLKQGPKLVRVSVAQIGSRMLNFRMSWHNPMK